MLVQVQMVCYCTIPHSQVAQKDSDEEKFSQFSEHGIGTWCMEEELAWHKVIYALLCSGELLGWFVGGLEWARL